MNKATSTLASILSIGLVTAVSAGPSVADGAPSYPKLPAYRADRFTDFVGINASPFERYLDSGPFVGAGTKFPEETLFDLGVRHYRTGLKNDLTLRDAPQRISAAFDKYGAQAMILVDPGKDGTPADIVSRLKTYEPGSVDLLEGPNEVNNKYPPQDLALKYKGKIDEAAGAAYMDDLYAAIKTDPGTRDIGVVAFTAIFTDYNLARPHSSFDFANMHSYQGYNVPSSSIEPNELDANNMLPDGVAIKPFVPTECGYNVERDVSNGTNKTGSLRAQALNIPMLLAEYFRHGIKRAYLFALTNADGYGLLESDQTTKRPSYYALKNFLATIEDSTWDTAAHKWVGASFRPRALAFDIGNAPATVHSLTLQKSNGQYLLLIWNEVRNFDESTRTDIVNQPVSVSLSISTPVEPRAEVLTQNDSGAYDVNAMDVVNGKVTIGVPSSVMIVRLNAKLDGDAGTIAPPTDLTGSATENSVHIYWHAPTADVASPAYFVYRNGEFLTSTMATSYDDTSSWIRPCLGYTYSVQSVDSAGRMSATAQVLVKTPNKRPDLICSGILTPSVHAGDTIKFQGTVKNIGDGATPRDTVAGLTFFVDGKYTAFGVTDGTPILPGEERVITSGVWTATQGAHLVEGVVDDVDRIPGERSKENNRTDRTLLVDVAATGELLGSGDPASGTLDLTTEGTEDWVLWGRTGRTDVDRKASGNHQIGDMTEVGSGYIDATPSFGIRASWTDGTPTVSLDGTYGCLWCNCVGHGYKFDAPADTTERVLRVYAAGIEGAACTLTAHLSDGSAPDYVSSTFNGNRGFDWAPVPSGFTTMFTIRYHAASAGQKLLVSWVLSGEPNRFLGQARLQAATLQMSKD